jgi:hypothetical protein
MADIVPTGTRLARGGRRSPRLATRLAARLALRTPRPATVVDLSLLGCLVECDARLAPGSVLDVEIELGSRSLALKARVAEVSLDGNALAARRSRFLVGLEFLGPGAAEESRLRAFLDAERRRRRSARTPAV